MAEKQAFRSENAPAPIGPYSQAIGARGLLFLSGQIPIDPVTGELVQGDIAAETRRVLDNMKAVLDASGCTFADVVKTTVFLTNLTDFPAVNAVYAEYFGDSPPARSTVQVAALPRGSRVEIDAIALAP